MLSTVTWLPRGFAVANPAAYDDAPEAVEGPEAAALALAQQRQLERAEALEAGATASGEDEAMDSTSRSPPLTALHEVLLMRLEDVPQTI